MAAWFLSSALRGQSTTHHTDTSPCFLRNPEWRSQLHIRRSFIKKKNSDSWLQQPALKSKRLLRPRHRDF